MAENLKTSVYRNGDAITNVTDGTQWINLTTGAWCNYNNSSSNECPYGKLYNWYAVADPRNVCPTGWHVPTDVEWTVLTDYLGGQSVAGGKMRSTTSWTPPNTTATNESGFSGLPGGARDDLNGGVFNGIGNAGFWWSSSEDLSFPANAWSRWLYYSYGTASRYNFIKQDGHSVRCLRDWVWVKRLKV